MAGRRIGEVDDNERASIFDVLLDELAERVAQKLAAKIAETKGNFGSDSRALEPNLDVKQAAGVLGISPRTLYPLAEKGEVPSVKVGSRRLFRPADLKAYLERRADPARKGSASARGTTSVQRINGLIR